MKLNTNKRIKALFTFFFNYSVQNFLLALCCCLILNELQCLFVQQSSNSWGTLLTYFLWYTWKGKYFQGSLLPGLRERISPPILGLFCYQKDS